MTDDELHADDFDGTDAWDIDPDWEHVPPAIAAQHGQQVEVTYRDDETGELVTEQVTSIVVPGLWAPRNRASGPAP